MSAGDLEIEPTKTFPSPRGPDRAAPRIGVAQVWQIAALAAGWAILSAWIVRLPVALVEPDDEMFYAAMKLFAKGKVLWSRAEIAEAVRFDSARGPLFGSAIAPFFRPYGRGDDQFGIEKSPGHPAELAAAYACGLVDWLHSAWALVSALFLYALVRRLGDRRGWMALTAAFLLLFNANSIAGQWRLYMSDYSSAVMVALGMGLYLWARESERLWLYALSGLWLSIAVAFRYTNVLGMCAIGVYEFIRAFEGPWRGAPARFLKRKGHWMAAAGALVGLIPLCWYLHELTGNPFRTGYAARFEREYSDYFSLTRSDPHVLFSLGHAPRVFFSGFPMFLLGFPILPLAVAGLGAMPKSRSRPALFLGLWAAAFWAPHLCYGWIRADAFVFMCRKFLPSAGALCVLAAAALGRLGGAGWALEIDADSTTQAVDRGRSLRPSPGGRAAAVSATAVIILLGLSLGCEFCIRYGLYARGQLAREGRGRWARRQGQPWYGGVGGAPGLGGLPAPPRPPEPAFIVPPPNPPSVSGAPLDRRPGAPAAERRSFADMRSAPRAGEPLREGPPLRPKEAEELRRSAQAVKPWLEAPGVEIFLSEGLAPEVVRAAEELRQSYASKGRFAASLPGDAPPKWNAAILVGQRERNARAQEILAQSPQTRPVELPGGGTAELAESKTALGLFIGGSTEEMVRALEALSRLVRQGPPLRRDERPVPPAGTQDPQKRGPKP